jgi:hypothetical protein
MSRRGDTVGGFAFLLAYFVPPVTGFYIFYLAWTNWVEGWHWALRVPACLVVLGLWTGVLRMVLVMVLVPLAGVVGAFFAPPPKLAPADRASLARTFRKYLLIAFGAGILLLSMFFMNPDIVRSWMFLAAMAVSGLYYAYTFFTAATLVWGGWWAIGALALTMVLNRGPYAILSVTPLLALVWSLTRATRQPASPTVNVSPQ